MQSNVTGNAESLERAHKKRQEIKNKLWFRHVRHNKLEQQIAIRQNINGAHDQLSEEETNERCPQIERKDISAHHLCALINTGSGKSGTISLSPASMSAAIVSNHSADGFPAGPSFTRCSAYSLHECSTQHSGEPGSLNRPGLLLSRAAQTRVLWFRTSKPSNGIWVRGCLKATMRAKLGTLVTEATRLKRSGTPADSAPNPTTYDHDFIQLSFERSRRWKVRSVCRASRRPATANKPTSGSKKVY